MVLDRNRICLDKEEVARMLNFFQDNSIIIDRPTWYYELAAHALELGVVKGPDGIWFVPELGK